MDKKGKFNFLDVLVSVLLLVVLAFYFFVPEEFKIYVLILFLVFTILDFFLIYFTVFSYSIKLRKLLDEANSLLMAAPLEILKERYQQIYQVYLKLSEKEKQNFYAQVVKFRQTLEDYMKNKQKLEELLEKAKEGTLAKRKKIYQQAFKLSQKLSTSLQERYQHDLALIRDWLERGRRR